MQLRIDCRQLLLGTRTTQSRLGGKHWHGSCFMHQRLWGGSPHGCPQDAQTRQQGGVAPLLLPWPCTTCKQ